jgi:5'-3' exonuclease
MLSDLGTNIVQTFLNGKTTIEEFKVDVNCNENPAPYTPFQQLLCIMPIRSMKKVLPAPYVGLAEGVLNEFFPDHFEIDLNGKTLPWEAVILIPFVDEEDALKAEASIMGSSLALTERELKRNHTSFDYPFFIYDRRHKNPSILKPIWAHFKKEYEDRTIK